MNKMKRIARLVRRRSIERLFKAGMYSVTYTRFEISSQGYFDEAGINPLDPEISQYFVEEVACFHRYEIDGVSLIFSETGRLSC
jgi:hypothetical protein